MIWIALKMLTGNRAKYLGMIIGVAFATGLMAQQSSIFCGLMWMTTSQIRDIHGADLWIMHPNVRFVDDLKPLSDGDLYRVRGVEGVDWAVRLYKGISRARLADGNYQQVILLGLDDGTLVGAPREMISGSILDLNMPDAVVMDDAGFKQLFPGEPLVPGKVFEMNDHRAVIVGVCKASRTFMTFPIIYTRYSRITDFVPSERKLMSFVLAQAKPDYAPERVCERITAQTGLQAMQRDDFVWKTIFYFLRETGIPINFGTTVILGFIVGTAIVGQTFYLFTVENLRQFGTLKAMGTSNGRLVGMILLQAVLVGLIGYGIGVGLAAGFGALIRDHTKLAFFMPWYILAGTGAAVLVIIVLASLLSIRRVLIVEPAIVFRG